MMFLNQVKYALMKKPDILEEGLIFKGVTIPPKGDFYDLQFQDRDRNTLYVLVKKDVDDSAVGRLLRYYYYVGQPHARFMLVGFTFMDGIKEVLLDWEFEYKELNEIEIRSFLNSKYEATNNNYSKGKTSNVESYPFNDEFVSQKCLTACDYF